MKSILIIGLCIFSWLLYSANFENLPTSVTQPDGSVLELFASGDEYANRLHDADGFSVIQSETDGYYYFAILQGDEPIASHYRADATDPHSLGLPRGVNISPALYQARVQAMNSHSRSGNRAPNTGTVNNLNVFIRFSDQTEFAESRGSYDAKFNAVGAEAFSMRNYFHQVSYDQLDYVTHHYPQCAPDVNLSYQDSHPRAYYMPYNAITNPEGYRDWQRTDREHALLANALNAISSQVPASLNIDADNDGYVDNVCFIIRGPHAAWAELLWAHRWALYTQDVYINGKMVWDFTFQPENQNSVRTLCHEMFHSVGAPDLYHYTYNGITPAGCWDIMESGNGHMGMYMKAKYGGWIDPIPTITAGTHYLSPVTSEFNSAYRVPLSASEYLVLEYRQQGSDVFEQGLPGSGLLIYRINDSLDGNAQGPPDEVYIYRPNGSVDVNGLIADAAFSQGNHRTEFNAFSNPSSFVTGGALGYVNIHSIGSAGETISFVLSDVSAPVPPVISDLQPSNGAILTGSDLIVQAEISAPNSSIQSVDFRFDGILLGTVYAPPYQLSIPTDFLSVGHHEIIVTATNIDQLSSSAASGIRIVNPLQQTWFSWITDEPVWGEYGRGAVPIKVAIELDLGTQEYVVKHLAFSAIADTWGLPQEPGLVNVKINRYANNAITEQTLLSLGDFIHPMDGRCEYIISNDTVISGQIAVILDMFEYQKIVFDTSAPCGKSWLTEPNRPWTDALGRGILGAAAIELILQAPNVQASDELNPAVISTLRNYPNPFSGSTNIEFSLKSPQDIRFSVYNLRGQLVHEELCSGLSAGAHALDWNGTDHSGRALANGIYLYRLQAAKHTRTGRLVLLK